MKQLLTTIGLVLAVAGMAFAQRAVSGTVTGDDGETLIGATVRVKDTRVGTFTDVNGRYTINVPAEGKTLVISYTGYTTQEVALGASNVVDVVLPAGVRLGEAVVTALGVSRESKSLGYQVQQVNAEDLNRASAIDPLRALQGKTAGVNIISSSGAAGAGSYVQIRGANSLSLGNQPLWVVDGVILDNTEISTGADRSSNDRLSGVANSNRAMDLNPEDIETISVLKGSAATALYGINAANGVVLVTTKRGRSDKNRKGLSVEYATSYSIDEVNKYVPLQQKYSKGTGGVYQSGETSGSTSYGALIDTLRFDDIPYFYDSRGHIVGQSDPAAKSKVTPIDPQKQFFQRGSTSQNSLAFGGGNDVTNFRISLGHTRSEGIIPKNIWRRTTVKASASTKFLEKFTASTTINYSKSGGDRIQQGSNTSGVMLGLLRTPPSFDNSNGSSSPADDPKAYILESGKQRNYRNGGGYDNPFWTVNKNPFTDDVNRVFGVFQLDYQLLSWLTVTAKTGTDFWADKRVSAFDINSRTTPAGRILYDNYFYQHFDTYGLLTGNPHISDNFSLDFVVGVNQYKQSLKNDYTRGDGFNLPDFYNIANAASIVSQSTDDELKRFAILGSANIGWKNQLYLGVTARNEWSSTLPKDNNHYFFPSVSLSWVFSEALNMNTTGAFSYGKLRGSWAKLGKDAPTYATRAYYSGAKSNDGWTDGLLIPGAFTLDNVLGNSQLKPEFTNTYEGGVELKFFHSRVGIDASYYYRKATDLIVPAQIAGSTGFTNAFLNTGAISTKGIDLQLELGIIRSKSFNWDMSVNFNRNRSVVDTLAPGLNQLFVKGFEGTAIYHVAGKEFGQIYGGTFQRNAAGQLVIDDDPSSDTYGYPVYSNKLEVIGNPNPDYILNINNVLTYKNIGISFLWDIKAGGQMWNGTEGALVFFGTAKSTENRGEKTVFKGVKASDGTANNIEVALDENWYEGNGGGFGDVAETFIQKTNWVRLREASIFYRLPKSVLDRTPLGDLTVTLSGRNLLLFTPYNGIDPETSLIGAAEGQGLDYFNMPGTRTYSIGLRATF